MKKKLTVFLLVAALTFAILATLVACDNDNGGGGDKTVSGLVIVDGEGAEHYSYDLGELVYGRDTPDYSGLKLYVKYSNGTKRELEESELTENDLTVAYYFNNEALSAAPTGYTVGRYEVTYTYKDYGVSVYFSVVTTATNSPYSILVENTTWDYGEEPTVKVLDSMLNEIDKSGYTVYYIAKSDYEEIEDSDDFILTLLQNSRNVYDNEERFVNMHPGKYYLFAYFDGIVRVNSILQEVTVNKATLTPVYDDDFDSFALMNTGWSRGETGTIKISRIGITTNIYNAEYDMALPIGGGITWKNADGDTIETSWYLEWKNPDEEIDCSINGQRKAFKCVFADECYADYEFPQTIAVELEKVYLNRPAVTDEYRDWAIRYDEQDHDVFFYYNSGVVSDSDAEIFNNILTIRDNDGNIVTIGEGGKLATLCDDGVYTFTFELKDKVNYEWRYIDYDADGEPTIEDTEDKSYEFTIMPFDWWFNPFPNGNYYDVAIDENRQIVLKVEPGTDNGASGSSPYKAGTLAATILSEYIFNGYTYTSAIDATVTVESRADGYDYIVINVTDFKELPNNYSGALLLKVTAKGDNHYADIERVFENLSISRYSYADASAVTCPVAFDDDTLELPTGTTVAELYEQYPQLITPLGKWVLEMDYRNDGTWEELSDIDALPSGSLKCRLVFKSNFVNNYTNIQSYEFTMIGTNN